MTGLILGEKWETAHKGTLKWYCLINANNIKYTECFTSVHVDYWTRFCDNLGSWGGRWGTNSVSLWRLFRPLWWALYNIHGFVCLLNKWKLFTYLHMNNCTMHCSLYHTIQQRINALLTWSHYATWYNNVSMHCSHYATWYNNVSNCEHMMWRNMIINRNRYNSSSVMSID